MVLFKPINFKVVVFYQKNVQYFTNNANLLFQLKYGHCVRILAKTHYACVCIFGGVPKYC